MTSPTGIQEINRLDGVALERRRARRGGAPLRERWREVRAAWASIRSCSATSAGARCRRTDFPELGERIEGKVRDCYVRGRPARTLVAQRPHQLLRRGRRHDPVQGPGAEPARRLLVREDARASRPTTCSRCPTPCVTVARECAPLPVEFVFRAYLTGVDEHVDLARLRGRRAAVLRPPPARRPAQAPAPARAAAHADDEGRAGRARRAHLARGS